MTSAVTEPPQAERLPLQGHPIAKEGRALRRHIDVNGPGEPDTAACVPSTRRCNPGENLYRRVRHTAQSTPRRTARWRRCCTPTSPPERTDQPRCGCLRLGSTHEHRDGDVDGTAVLRSVRPPNLRAHDLATGRKVRRLDALSCRGVRPVLARLAEGGHQREVGTSGCRGECAGLPTSVRGQDQRSVSQSGCASRSKARAGQEGSRHAMSGSPSGEPASSCSNS